MSTLVYETKHELSEVVFSFSNPHFKCAPSETWIAIILC